MESMSEHNETLAAKRERESLSELRRKLYGVAADIRALTARSDARERGVHYTEVQNIAAQIENIADNGGEVCERK